MLMFLYTVHGLLVTTVSACVSGPLVLIPQTDSTCELARGAMQEIGSVELRLAEVRLNDKGESNELWLDVMGKHHGRDGKLCIVLTSNSPSPVFAEGRTQAERSVSPIERLASSETAAVMAMLTAEQEAEMSKPLPPGWKVYWSKSKNKPYYKHKESGQIVWNIPPQEDGAAKSEGSV